MFKNILDGRGAIIFSDFMLTPDIPLTDQVDALKEDMMQIELKGDMIIDIGWYPSFDIEGAFHLYLIKNFDWDNPLLLFKTNNLNDLEQLVDKIITKANLIKKTID